MVVYYNLHHLIVMFMLCFIFTHPLLLDIVIAQVILYSPLCSWFH